MKKLLPILLSGILALNACKKENAAEVTPATDRDTLALAGPSITQKRIVSGLSPENVTDGAVVTITGSNLSTSGNGMAVYFKNVPGKIQSVKSTEIKVIAPKTSTGVVTVKINGKAVPTSSTLAYTYYTPATIKGDVTLLTQNDINAFVKAHTGQQLQIKGSFSIGKWRVDNNISSLAGLNNMISTVSGGLGLYGIKTPEPTFLNGLISIGGLSVSDCDFKSLHLNKLTSFSGGFSLQKLGRLVTIQIKTFVNVGDLEIFGCDHADLSFLNSVKTASLIRMYGLGKTEIRMDNLIAANGINFSLLKSPVISFKSLTNVNGEVSIFIDEDLSVLNFKSLKTVAAKLYIANTNITDLGGFEVLQTVGALNLSNNPSLRNLHGLEHLTVFKFPAIIGILYKMEIGVGLKGLPRILGGLLIQSNSKLVSMAGLQNVKSLPIAYISDNALLNDFCPFKSAVVKLRAMPSYNYDFDNGTGGVIFKETIPAISIYNNGDYASQRETLKAVELCR